MCTDDRSEIICLISIDSTHFSRESLETITDWAEKRHSAIRYLVLEVPERHNIRAFEGFSEGEAIQLIRERGRDCRERLGLKDSSLISWDCVCERVGFKPILGKVLECFEHNGSFRRHCLSQTFSNLQPRFLQKGISKKSDPLVRTAVHYLLEELAIKMGAFQTGVFEGEVLPVDEMGVVTDLYSGKYIDCPVSERGFKVFSIQNGNVRLTEYNRQACNS